MNTKTADRIVVKFFLRHGAIVDWPVPGDTAQFSLSGLAVNIRSTGFFIAPDLYIPSDEIACIGIGGVAVKMPGVHHQPPARPQ